LKVARKRPIINFSPPFLGSMSSLCAGVDPSEPINCEIWEIRCRWRCLWDLLLWVDLTVLRSAYP